MKKPVDYKNLQRVIEAGVLDACKDAGIERCAINVDIGAMVAVSSSGAEQMPIVTVQVTELDAEQMAALRAAMIGQEGN